MSIRLNEGTKRFLKDAAKAGVTLGALAFLGHEYQQFATQAFDPEAYQAAMENADAILKVDLAYLKTVVLNLGWIVPVLKAGLDLSRLKERWRRLRSAEA